MKTWLKLLCLFITCCGAVAFILMAMVMREMNISNWWVYGVGAAGNLFSALLMTSQLK